MEIIPTDQAAVSAGVAQLARALAAHRAGRRTPSIKGTIPAQVFYDVRDLTGVVSGADLHEFFSDVLGGEPSPAGAVEIEIEKIFESPYGELLAEAVVAPVGAVAAAIRRYTA